MEVHVKELIESIQKDGFEEAEKRSNAILESAKKEASEIIAKAKREAAETVENAKSEALKIESSSRSTLEQAARDLLLALEQNIKQVLQDALFTQVSKNMSGKVLTEAIEMVIKSDVSDVATSVVEISEADGKKIHDGLKKSLEKEIKKGLLIKPVSTMKGGFLIKQQDGKAYYDFSVEEIANAMTKLVNPYLSAIIAEAANKGA